MIGTIYVDCLENALRHTCFRHYTTVEALAHILGDKVFRLSSLDKMNDPIESDRLSNTVTSRFFALCFSHGEEENIPLWRIYGRDVSGVCIELDSLGFFTQTDNYYGYSKDGVFFDPRIIDVHYTNNLNAFNISVKLESPDDTISMVACCGFVKTKAWEFERETRVLCSFNDWPSNIPKGEQEAPSYIFVRIPDDMLMKFRIRFNPFISNEMKELIKGGILRINKEFPEENFLDSSLENKIRI